MEWYRSPLTLIKKANKSIFQNVKILLLTTFWSYVGIIYCVWHSERFCLEACGKPAKTDTKAKCFPPPQTPSELTLIHARKKCVFKLLQGTSSRHVPLCTSLNVYLFFSLFLSLVKLGRITLDWILFELVSNTKWGVLQWVTQPLYQLHNWWYTLPNWTKLGAKYI